MLCLHYLRSHLTEHMKILPKVFNGFQSRACGLEVQWGLIRTTIVRHVEIKMLPIFNSSFRWLTFDETSCRHHQQGRWQARIGRVAGNKDLYLGTFGKLLFLVFNKELKLLMYWN